MNFKRTTLDNCADEATGLVVVIDVLRAFTTAAFALAGGAERLLLVSEVDEALALRQRFPNALVMGEVRGIKPDSFDFGNSPAEIALADVAGRPFIQRTSAGTLGVVRSQKADILLTASFPVAEATVQAIQRWRPHTVSFVITGIFPGRAGAEDIALADYLELRLRGERPSPAPFLQRVHESDSGRIFANPARPDHPVIDLDYATALDRFDFALRVTRENGLHILQKHI
ncbi:MAG: 2-phosphosulfolactate phosphatase [Ardenticatenaceae bacterium]|nr:2-phosphosulfolactate phosphatase [Anaerolineales bacterium]MCB8921217.1 2-phosphosulfolactate phosphatase [Ardenticatenaceae bacterium]MCB8992183.1 2-phosphosulfolactate phosphatase [Ardenticatenaceae bacterium]MCB9004291.1 2-phosphosulfolactate phosphatase [Ardenticatenaceae bacterium]